MQKVLVTGAAGFIGFHLAHRLAKEGHTVVGIDNLNDYYDPRLKLARLKELEPLPNFTFVNLDLLAYDALEGLFKVQHFDVVVHLAAQPGVRYALTNPRAYIENNIVGFFNVLEALRHFPVSHFVYASSSSVYGGNKTLPFSIHDSVDHPLSLYAATKKSDELIAHAYAHLYNIPMTGLRFFTVYGPWGRPDMAMYLFTKNLIEGKPIEVFNQGQHYRDFTYIDDIIESMVRILPKIPTPIPSPTPLTPGVSLAPWRVYNIGNQQPIHLLEYIKIIEKHVGRQAILEFKSAQLGDMQDTHADVQDLEALIDYKPTITINEGVQRFVAWYRIYEQV